MKINKIKIGIDGSSMKAGAKEAKDALHGVGREAEKTDEVLEELERQLESLQKEARQTAEDLKKQEKAEKAAADSAKKLGMQVLGLVAGYKAFTAVLSVVQDLMDFETQLVAVAKTADLSRDSLGVLSDEMLEFATDTGTAKEAMLDIATVAGQMGIKGTSNITKFTEAMAMLEESSQGTLKGELGATAVARILNVTGEGVSGVREYASVITTLGNNVAATEGKIVHLATQVALSTAAFNVSAAENTAMGATLAELGVRAELAGTTIGRTMRMMDRSIRGGGESMELLTQIMGQGAEEIEQTFSARPMQGVVEFIEGLGRVADAGGSVEIALESVGLEGQQLLKVMPTLALNAGLLEKSFGLMNDELGTTVAIDREFARSQDTIQTQVNRTVQIWGAAKQKLSEHNGALQETIGWFADLEQVMFNVGDTTEASSVSTEIFAAAIKTAAIPAAALAVTSLAGAVTALAPALTVAAARQWVFNAAVSANPYVMAAAAIAAVGTAILGFGLLASDAAKSGDELADSLNRISQEAESMEDLDIRLARALKLGDERKQMSIYTAQIGQLEDALVKLEKQSTGITFQDLADSLSIDVIDLPETARRINSVKKMYGDGYEDIKKQFMADLPGLEVPRIEAKNQIEDRIKQLEALKKGITPSVDITNFQGDSGEESKLLSKMVGIYDQMVKQAHSYAKAAKSAAQASEDQTGALQFQLDNMDVEKDKRAILLATMQMEQDLQRKGVKNATELADQYRDTAMALLEQTNAYKIAEQEGQEFQKMEEDLIQSTIRARKQRGDTIADLMLERQMLGMTGAERQLVNEGIRMTTILRQTETDNIEAQVEEYLKLVEAMQNETAWYNLAATISNSVGDTFNDLILGTTSFQDAINNLYSSVARAVLEKQVTTPLVEGLTSKLATALPKVFGEASSQAAGAAASAKILVDAGLVLSATMKTGAEIAAARLEAAAVQISIAMASGSVPTAGAAPVPGTNFKGNAFSMGNVVPHEKGDIVSQLSYFPMANGGIGSVAEKEPEAIMPLARTSAGRLGVEVANAGGGGGGVTNNFYQNVYTRDADSFRSSRKQLQDAAQRTK